MAMTVSWGNGVSHRYLTGYEINIKEDGTVICYAIDTDGKPYHDIHKMPNKEITVNVSDIDNTYSGWKAKYKNS